jgi:GAF domain-containing protein
VGAKKEIPIQVRNQVLGRIDARKIDGAGDWTPQETDLLAELAQHLGAALENARLYETTRRHARRDRTTADIVGKIRASGDVQSILETATEELVKKLGASRAVIQLGDPSDRSGLPRGRQAEPSTRENEGISHHKRNGHEEAA